MILEPNAILGFGPVRAATLTWRLLLRPERRSIFLLSLLMAGNGLLQSVSLVAFIPLVGLMLGGGIESSRQLAMVHAWLGRPEPSLFVLYVGAGFLAVIVVQELLGIAEAWWQNMLIASVEQRMAVDLLRRCMAAPYVWFLSRNRTLLAKEINGDTAVWARSCLKGILTLASGLLVLAPMLALLVVLSPAIGLGLLIAGAGLAMASLRVMRPFIDRMSRRKQRATDGAYVILNHALVGTKDVKIGAKEEFFTEQFAKQARILATSRAKASIPQPLLGSVMNLGLAIAVVLFAVYASGAGSARSDLIATLAIYGLAAMKLIPLFHQVTSALAAVQSAIPSVEAVHRTSLELAGAAEIEEREHTQERGALDRGTRNEVPQQWERLRFEGVGYRYPASDAWALRGIDLTVERGKTYGLVGRSAAGKSTLVDLLAGLLRPSEGTVTVDGRSLGELDPRVWRTRIGYVPQSPYIADDSLRANVAFGVPRERVDDGRVRLCLRLANLGQLTEQLPRGLDSALGDLGQRLSGGQRQRIAIARALYAHPSILVLDEATSAVDAISEAEIYEALDNLGGDITILIVAHRLSMVRASHHLFMLEGGRLLAEGTFDELRIASEPFRRLVALSTGSSGRSAEFAASGSS